MDIAFRITYYSEEFAIVSRYPMKSCSHMSTTNHKKIAIHITVGTVGLLLTIFCSGVLFFVLYGKNMAQNNDYLPITEESTQIASTTINVSLFPVGVNPHKKEIIENPSVSVFFENHVSVKNNQTGIYANWLSKAVGKLALKSWYQNLASLSSRILIIESGERKEQVADHFAQILGWTEEEKNNFLNAIEVAEPELTDGKFFPGTYTVARKSSPEVVIPLVTDRFKNEVLSRYDSSIESVVPLTDALTIASLLEREAYDFEDMRLIAGVIWNRLFVGMNLQIDATLQYAKGGTSHEVWWPRVVPDDKYISSLYNTYKNPGLPPAPIANPSLEAILAALNPRKTECMYYFHDSHAGFHCSKTYKEHVALLKEYYGQGK